MFYVCLYVPRVLCVDVLSQSVLFAESTVRISKRLLRLRVYDRSKLALTIWQWVYMEKVVVLFKQGSEKLNVEN